MMLNSKSIGNKIAQARKKMNLSQAEIAQKIPISPQAVGKWERGESMPDITTLNRLAEILHVDLNYFSENFTSDESETLNTQKLTETLEDTSGNLRKKFEWNWDMSRGNWTDADFSGLKNLKEKFSSSNVRNCKFLNSDLSGLILAKNNIELSDFSHSDLRDSKIQSSNLSENQFVECSFIDVELYKSNIEKCDFSQANFSGAEILMSNFGTNIVTDVVWKFTKFEKSSLDNMIFTGNIEDCHFEHCSFYRGKFENAVILNTFFKYNDRFKKVEFKNCQVDSITYAFLKNNQANMSGISLIESVM